MKNFKSLQAEMSLETQARSQSLYESYEAALKVNAENDGFDPDLDPDNYEAMEFEEVELQPEPVVD